jgi:hypothetical protein
MEELERQLDEPTYPDVIGVSELAMLLGVSRQRWPKQLVPPQLPDVRCFLRNSHVARL